MPISSGSIAFIGAARFQGYWNATTNEGSGSCVDGATCLTYENLFTEGSSVQGGYNTNLSTDGAYTGQSYSLTASAGDYWQVTGAGGFDVEGETGWRSNDWLIFSGSGASARWRKLAYEDTIASIIIGDLSAPATFHLSGSSNRQVLFISASSDADAIMSGSDNFTFQHHRGGESATSNLLLTGNFHIADDNKLYFGAAPDASFEYDEDGTDTLLYAGASLRISDDVKLQFGSDGDSFIQYRETDIGGDDYLVISGSAKGVVLSGSLVDLPGSMQLTGSLRVGAGYLSTNTLDGITIAAGSGDDAALDFVQESAATTPGFGKGVSTGFRWVYDGGADDLYLKGGYLTNETTILAIDRGGSGTNFSATGSINAIHPLTASQGVHVLDDKRLYFGNNLDALIQYREDEAGGDDYLVISGSAKGIAVSGSTITLDGNLQVTGSGVFTTDVSVGDDLSLTSDSAIFSIGAGNDFTIVHDGTTGATIAANPVTITSAGAATWSAAAGALTVDAAANTLTLDGHTGVTVQSTNSGDITLDSVADIVLDAGGADILFKDDGTLIGGFKNTATNLIISSSISDKDIMFMGSDNNVAVTALTLDMSDAGTAIFSGHVHPGSDNSVDLGSASKRWRNIYTGDLHLKNEKGDWTIVEEEDYLCVVNNKTNKRYKMMLQEIEEEQRCQ